jgi:hypothetical protein
MNAFFRRHPLLRDALLWSVPALLFGAALRLILLHYSPCAFWGADSRSYFGFANGVLNDFYFSLNEKRRYLYPIFLLPVAALPGCPLRTLAWIQAGIGLATIVPFAYTVRRIFAGWRLLVVPLTVLLAGLPVFLWHEHELIGDTFLLNGLVWCVADWAAWTCQTDPARARRLWWLFFAAFAFIVLSKASVKFFWPGLLAAFVFVGAWRVLRWQHGVALGALFLAGLTVGDDDQGAWLIYNSAFPLTQLDSPLHADIKAELRDWVLAKRERIDAYADEDYEVQKYLRGPEKEASRPLLQTLAKDRKALSRVYRDLAVEGIRAEPLAFLSIGLHRMLNSCNPSDLSEWRFQADYFSNRLATETIADHRAPEETLRLVFGIPRSGPFPAVDQFRAWTNPRPDSAAARWLPAYVHAYQAAGALVKRPDSGLKPIADYRPTFLGWWLLLGAAISLLPPYFRALGVWVLLLGVGLFATYLVGIQHVRYFAPAWPVVLLALGAAIDGPFRSIMRLRKSLP